MQQSNISNQLKLQRRINQLEIELQRSEKSRSDLIELLKKRQVSNTLFSHDNQNTNYVKKLQDEVQQLHVDNEALQSQYANLALLNNDYQKRQLDYQQQLQEMLNNAKNLQQLQKQTSFQLQKEKEASKQLQMQLNDEKLLSQQLVDVQAEISSQNDIQQKLNQQLQMENLQLLNQIENLKKQNVDFQLNQQSNQQQFLLNQSNQQQQKQQYNQSIQQQYNQSTQQQSIQNQNQHQLIKSTQQNLIAQNIPRSTLSQKYQNLAQQINNLKTPLKQEELTNSNIFDQLDLQIGNGNVQDSQAPKIDLGIDPIELERALQNELDAMRLLGNDLKQLGKGNLK